MSNASLPTEILDLVNRLASATRLLVSSDFDGTLASFEVDTDAPTLEPVARVALRKLTEQPGTFVSVISGRGLADLANRFDGIPGVRLVGSHGGEFDIGLTTPLTEAQEDLLRFAEREAQELSTQFPGTRIERKPHGIAFHYRGYKGKNVESLLTELTRRFAQRAGGYLKSGHQVLEYCVVQSNKGAALTRVCQQLQPTAVLFIGDDRTDEDAFAVLSTEDAGIKVGPETTRARYRLQSINEVARFLAMLADARAHWLAAIPGAPIDHHVFLSDLRTIALIDPRASVVWMCAPRIDSPPIFGSLVGGPGAGEFRIECEGAYTQAYEDETLICRTKIGSVTVTDFLECGEGRPFQRAGRTDLIRYIEGNSEVCIRFAPRLDFGRIATRLVLIDGGIRVDGGNSPMVLRSEGVAWELQREGAHHTAVTRHVPSTGILLELCVGTNSIPLTAASFDKKKERAERFWRGWVNSLTLPTIARREVVQSALVLRGLSYGPSGGIAAAATTSLPECIGGIRNWDYRFCWPRDAALSAHALVRLGAMGPAMKLLDWMLNILEDCPVGQFLRPVYTVAGRELMGEAEVAEAMGYRGSRPVRVGNLAAQQLQLDSLGPVSLLLGELARRGAPLSPEHLALATQMVSLVRNRWQDPDHGIWEVRSEQRHFVHSKLMCWLTVSECLVAARSMGHEQEDWVALREAIRASIEQHGFSRESNSYMAAYGFDASDAALLWVVLSGFHPPDHPRVQGTVQRVMEHLLRNNSVFRYHFNDALVGQEGAFHICTAWLIEALVMMGRRAEAAQLFESYCARLGPTGLMSEQWDDEKGVALGNFPQAYSHLGLINCAYVLGATHESS